MTPDPVEALHDRVLAGDRRAIARALTVIEQGNARARTLIAALHARTGRAHLIGLSGSGGVGKSSLAAALTERWRSVGRRVGVVAVDPSSPFTGGSLLGDRVRLERFHADPDVFVRSMATRGAGGGIARATLDSARVLDAAGFDVVLVETIGAGQDEVEVASAVETVVVVEAPNLGDDVQALKAGLLEIADVIALNKGDLPGSDRAVATLRATLALVEAREWTPPIVKVSAQTGDGVDELVGAIDAHLEWLDAEEGANRRQRAQRRARAELMRLLGEAALQAVLRRVEDPALDTISAAIAAREIDPYTAAARTLDRA